MTDHPIPTRATTHDQHDAHLAEAGIHLPRTVEEAHLLRHRVRPDARTAVVVGGGLVGLAATGALHGRGLDVTLVESAPHVLPALDPALASSWRRR